MDNSQLVLCEEMIDIYKNLDASSHTITDIINFSRLKINDKDSRESQIEYDIKEAQGIQIALKPQGSYLFARIETVQFEEIEDVSENEFLQLKLRYTELHVKAAEYLSSRIGSPDFGGKFGDAEYPTDLTNSSLVVYWEGFRAYLTCEANLNGYDDRFEVNIYIGLQQ